MSYGTHATAIVGYTYNADVYCVDCMFEMRVDVCRTTECHGHKIVGLTSQNEFKCTDESSYDSSIYPKVIFASSVEGPDRCGKCGEYLVGDASDYANYEEDE